MIKASVNGDWGKTEKFLSRSVNKRNYVSILTKYGELGLKALKEATPVRTGVTAASWRYEIIAERNSYRIEFHNDNVNNGVNIALILNYGHATWGGAWVEGRHYIEPALGSVFDDLADSMWREVTSK